MYLTPSALLTHGGKAQKHAQLLQEAQPMYLTPSALLTHA